MYDVDATALPYPLVFSRKLKLAISLMVAAARAPQRWAYHFAFLCAAQKNPPSSLPLKKKKITKVMRTTRRIKQIFKRAVQLLTSLECSKSVSVSPTRRIISRSRHVQLFSKKWKRGQKITIYVQSNILQTLLFLLIVFFANYIPVTRARHNGFTMTLKHFLYYFASCIGSSFPCLWDIIVFGTFVIAF